MSKKAKKANKQLDRFLWLGALVLVAVAVVILLDHFKLIRYNPASAPAGVIATAKQEAADFRRYQPATYPQSYFLFSAPASDMGMRVGLQTEHYLYLEADAASQASNQDLAALERILKKAGYKQYAKVGDEHTTAINYRHRRGGGECAVIYNNAYLALSCVQTAKLLAERQRLQPFYQALQVKEPPKSERDILVVEATRSSQTPGYQWAQGGLGSVTGGGASLLFYKVPEGPWVFSHGTQQGWDCNQIEQNNDARLALLGLECTEFGAETDGAIRRVR